MAHPIAKKSNSDGSAVIESLPVIALLILLCGGLLTGGYLLFARTWLSYQSDQALYCLAEQRVSCTREFKLRVQRFLPWGELQHLQMNRGDEEWKISFRWSGAGTQMHFRKQLSTRRILKNRGLHW